MMDQKKKMIAIILAAVAVVLVLALTIGLAVYFGNKDEPAPDDPAVTGGSEIGTYYFDATIQEYTLTLNEGNTFVLFVKDETSPGTYTLAEGVLTLDFSAEGKETITATLEDSVITLTYNGATMRFLKKVTYTVSFETNGGSSVEAQSVLNGKTVTKPADPVRDGYLFVGWYADSEFKTPFAFGADPVTADITVYARWSEDLLDGAEYTVDFNANYENAVNPAAVQTVGGKLFDLPVIERAGYEFKGWWISMSDNGSKLSYRYADGMVLDAHTTLYALWQSTDRGTKLPDPVVNVTSGTITWDVVSDARSYNVKVIAPSGITVVNEDTSSTTLNVAFSGYEAGEYEIRVVANANSGDANNSEAVRYYTNKALGRVSVFQVIDSVLVYNTVENAEKYLISVVCGNPDHKHTDFDNGTSRIFNFANCAMTEGGIRFTVTAVADGFASSVSKVFVYSKDLAAVAGLRYDEATQTVLWDEVPNAAAYMVSVKCGNAAHNHEYVNVGSKTSVSLKECDAVEGGIVVKVYPKTNGYNSPAASEYTANKTTIATPSDIRINGTIISWAAVSGATKYEVQVGTTKYDATETNFDLSVALNWVEGSAYAISVRAIGATESLWSDVLNARYNVMNDQLKYSQSVLTWSPVIGATSYELQVNDGEIQPITDGSSSAKITLTKAGLNVLKVRSVDGANRSDWVQLEVYAHAVTFDTRGGSAIPVHYKAVGDLIELPVTEKVGYSFAAWYNVPGGPDSNGKAYTDELFAESGAIVLYAYYTPAKYTITYNYGTGGTGEKTSDEVAYERDYQLTVPVPNTVTGAFGGWFSAPSGMGTQYTDANGKSLAPWTSTEGAEVYAFWIDSALTFNLTKVSGKDAYVVSAGERIALLSEVTIPATYNGLPVAMIAGNAFQNCTNLKVLNIPATLEQISLINPFTGCTNLEAVNVYAVEGNSNARYWSENGVLFDNGTTGTAQPKLLYMPLAKTGTYQIPAGISEIPEGAFANSSLSKVIVPTSVTKIGKNAFANSKKLTSVIFETSEGEAALTIGANAFSGCTMLEKIILPARLADITLTKYSISNGNVVVDDVDNAFAGCSSLVSITVVTGNQKYKSVDGVLYSADGKTLVYCPATKEGAFVIPSGTQIIAPGAFVGCNGLTEVTVPNTVTLIGECAFYGLEDKLTKVTFAGNGFNDMIVDKYAFRGCSALAEVVFEAGSRVTTLSEGAFYGCEALAAIEIPASMTRIDGEAFRDCTELATLTFAASTKELAFGEDVFYNCTSLTSVSLPVNVSKIPGIFNGCTSLTEVKVAADSPYFTSEDGVVFNKEKTEILFFPQGKTGEYTLPATVTTIANGVFRNVTGLTKLTIGNAITTIGDEAFYGSNISEIVFTGDATGTLTVGNSAFEYATIGTLTLPAHTKTIGKSAFANSTFNTITLNEGIESLGEYAFYYATGSNAVTVPASVKTIGAYCFAGEGDSYSWTPDYGTNVVLTVENSMLETIGDHAFEGNTFLTSIVIPQKVKTIGNYAFYDCETLDVVEFASECELETIGAYAFAFSSSWSSSDLTTIKLPKKLTSIGAYAFSNTSLVTVEFEDGGEGAGDLVLGAPYVYTQTDYNGVTTKKVVIGRVFNYCTDLKSVIFPSNLTEINEYSFYSAGDELTVDFGSNSRLTTIGAYCFYYSDLVSINIPGSVRNLAPYVDAQNGITYDRLGIGAYAFYGLWDTLTSVTFDMNGTEPLTIGANAFENCDLLTTLELPKRLAPYTSHTGEVLQPFANGADVFAESIGLTSVVIQDGGAYYNDIDGVVYTADFSELVYCPAGKTGEISVPATVTKIHDRAFYACTELTAITFVGGDAGMTIGDEAFAECSGLTALVLPSNAVSVGSGAFADCSALESLTLSAKLQNFDGTMIDGCEALESILVNGESDFFYSDNGVLYSADKTMLISYPTGREGTEYTVLPTATVIGSSAFGENKNLVTLVLPAGLKEIRRNAFNYCTALTNVVIPNTVEVIGDSAFAFTSALTGISFEKGGTSKLVIAYSAFSNSGVANLELPARLAVLGDSVFYRSKIQNVTFEAGSQLTEIGSNLFQASSVVSVVFPDGVVSIGDGTFSGCSSLESVIFGEGLITLGDETFTETSVQYVHLPASLKTIGAETFAECASLKTVTFAPNAQLTKLPAGTFYGCTSLESIVIPACVKELEDRDTSTSYSYGVFQGASSLQSVTFENGSMLEKIGVYAFYECSALVEFHVPASVSTLGESAFERCTALETVSIPVTTTRLGNELFYGCSALSDVDLKTGATELPGYMFYNCSSLKTLTIPASVGAFGGSCFSGSGLEAFEVAAGNTRLTVVDGVLYSADKTAIVCYPPKKQAATVIIPKEVTSIGANTFANMTGLKEVIFEEGGDQPLVIGESAFAYCYQLYNVVLPERLTTIGYRAFYSCYNLTTVTIPENVTLIDDGAFSSCDKLVEVFNKSQLDISLEGEYGAHGYIATYAYNVYTPTEGVSIVTVDENGYVFMTLEGSVYLMGYRGTETDLVLPAAFDGFFSRAFYRNSDLTSIFVPAGAGTEYMGSSVFYGCDKVTLLMGEASKPSAWSSSWNSSRPVIWTYDGAEHTYTFVTNGADPIVPIISKDPITIPVPTRDGYVFNGWYDNEALEGTAITGTYYNAEKTTLYAAWLTEEEFNALFAGTSAEYAIELNLSTPVDVVIDQGGEKVWFKYTATESGTYRALLTGGDTKIEIRDNPEDYYADSTLWASSGSGYTTIDEEVNLTAGQTYYFAVLFYYKSTTGTLEFTISKA